MVKGYIWEAFFWLDSFRLPPPSLPPPPLIIWSFDVLFTCLLCLPSFLPCNTFPYSEVPDAQEVASETLSQSSDSSTVSSSVFQAEKPPSHSKAKSPSSNSASLADSSVSYCHSICSSPSSPASVSSNYQNSSASITPKASPTVEKLPYVPHSPFHLFSYDFEESPASGKEKETEVMRENR